MIDDIFIKDRNGIPVSLDDKEYYKIKEVILETKSLVQEMNTTICDYKKARDYLSLISKREIDETVILNTPFYTDFGRNIILGKNVFINFNCTFMDRGIIEIHDNVFIGPNVSIISENHGIEPSKRREITSKKIVIEENVWIGANSIILPGVTIRKNSIVAAGSVVTKDVEENTIVAKNPAVVIKKIEEK